MSEKYSTAELIEALNRKTRGYGFADVQENEIDAIIARLRAADRLCGWAEAVLADHDERMVLYPEKNNQESRMRVMAGIRKAIAKYDGKEEVNLD
jgi:hypothetical protein